MKIGVIGCGTVGQAVARVFMDSHEIRCWDTLAERTTFSKHACFESDICFVCLPEGVLDLFFSGITGHVGNLVLKSTVPIGTTKHLAEKFNLPNIVHNPEFLTARVAFADVHCPAQHIIGYPDYNADSPKSIWSHPIRKLYKERFPGVAIREMHSDESEAVKLFTNAFFAAKIAFFNEVRTLADKLGLDWENVLEGMLGDGRIAHPHTQVPGPDGRRGFGGKCLPKDLKHLWQQMQNAGLQSWIVEGAMARNSQVDRKEDGK